MSGLKRALIIASEVIETSRTRKYTCIFSERKSYRTY